MIRGHVLVVGGTGMLRDASLGLASEWGVVSVVARSHARLSGLARDADARGVRFHPIAVDWHDTQRLALGLRAAIGAHGPIELAVCWVHSDAPSALLTVMDVIGSERTPPRLFHVVGVASVEPAGVDVEGVRSAAGIAYRRVVLGFVIEGDKSRWLTDDEISAGVLAAVRDDAIETIVGVVEPWSRRP